LPALVVDGLFELFVPDPALRQSISSDMPDSDIRRHAIKDGMQTLRMDGLKKVLEGITTIEQVLGATPED